MDFGIIFEEASVFIYHIRAAHGVYYSFGRIDFRRSEAMNDSTIRNKL